VTVKLDSTVLVFVLIGIPTKSLDWLYETQSTNAQMRADLFNGVNSVQQKITYEQEK